MAETLSDSSPDPSQSAMDFIIQGITSHGKAFRPSDWADRLCGIMSRFHPDGGSGYGRHLQFSPYVVPAMLDGIRSVVVDGRLVGIEPLAYEFLRSFARDNDLRLVEACILPDLPLANANPSR